MCGRIPPLKLSSFSFPGPASCPPHHHPAWSEARGARSTEQNPPAPCPCSVYPAHCTLLFASSSALSSFRWFPCPRRQSNTFHPIPGTCTGRPCKTARSASAEHGVRNPRLFSFSDSSSLIAKNHEPRTTDKRTTDRKPGPPLLIHLPKRHQNRISKIFCLFFRMFSHYYHHDLRAPDTAAGARGYLYGTGVAFWLSVRCSAS